MSRIDQTFGLPMQGLKLFETRSEVIANNLSNADTPGYKAKDIDFKAILGGQMDQSAALSLTPAQSRSTSSGHMPLSGDVSVSGFATKYRIAAQNAADHNTVEEATEKAAHAENSIRYQAAFYFLDGRIKGLLSAIKGE